VAYCQPEDTGFILNAKENNVMIRPVLLLGLMLMLLAGCADTGNTASDNTESITGTVSEISPSAQIILLTEPQNGFDTIALTEATTIVLADGTTTDLTAVQPETTIRASGEAGESNALLAEEIVVLTQP
jgi:ABC-type Fe3+-hydroxamate transport system substrate-binding protein